MTVYRQFRLPDGILLPLGIEITKISEYDSYEKRLDADEAEARLLKTAVGSVQDALLAGTVQQVRHTLTQGGGLYCLRSRLQCEEMIARMVPVRYPYSKDDES